MTRKELIKAIYDSTDLWSCPADPCDLPEEEGNTGECCWKCAEKQLAEYEEKIIKKFINKVCGFRTYNNDLSLIDLKIVAQQFKEQKMNVCNKCKWCYWYCQSVDLVNKCDGDTKTCADFVKVLSRGKRTEANKSFNEAYAKGREDAIDEVIKECRDRTSHYLDGEPFKYMRELTDIAKYLKEKLE